MANLSLSGRVVRSIDLAPLSGGANPHMADYYFPDGNPKLVEIADPNDWLPGDVLVYGPSFTAGRKAGHVNLYVGPFTGTDRSGKTYNLSDGVEMVEARGE